MVIGYMPRFAREIKYPEPHKYEIFASVIEGIPAKQKGDRNRRCQVDHHTVSEVDTLCRFKIPVLTVGQRVLC
jgi:hypothetical protein